MKKEKGLGKATNAPILNDCACEGELPAKAGGMPEEGHHSAGTADIQVRVSDRTAKYYSLYVKADRFFDQLIDIVKSDFGDGALEDSLYAPYTQVTETLKNCMIQSLKDNLFMENKGQI